MRRLRFVLAALAVSAWAAGPLAGAAGAALVAPTYQSSSPEKGAMMDEPPSEVTVTFSEPLDSSSVMSVFDECGRDIDAGAATITLNEMEVGIDATPAGMYKVVYKAVGLGGVTGETAGSFEFMVHDGKPCGGDKGGHGGHGNHGGKNKGTGKGHGNHGGGHGNGGGDHDDHGGRTTGHSGMTGHSGTPGAHSTGTHDGHMGTTGGDNKHAQHGGGHRGDGKGSPSDDPSPPVAAGPGGAPTSADAQAMLIGLGLALFVGVLGGWLLRTSGGLA